MLQNPVSVHRLPIQTVIRVQVERWHVMREFWKFPAAMAPLALALALTSHAFASSFTLQNTNLSGVTNVGTVTVTDTGSGQVP